MKVVNFPKKPRRPCPDCGTPLFRRTSTFVTPLLSRTLMVCKNYLCGAAFAGYDEITHRVKPSLKRNPEVKLPIARGRARKELFKELAGESDANAPDDQ